METDSNSYLDRRRAFSRQYLVGQGIELGALHNPLWVSERASVRYVDRLDVPSLRKHYPELDGFSLVQVDIVDDGETLQTIEDLSLDFIIANHMLEHTENPIGTIRNHLRKVRNGGVIYYAVPDKRYTFDVERPLTSFDHLVRDDQEGPQVSRIQHFEEWARLVNKVPLELLEEHVSELIRTRYSIHFHVWDRPRFESFLSQVGDYLGHSFRVEHFSQNENEMIAVLRRDSSRASLFPWFSRLLSSRGSWIRRRSA
jgi:SAM-dependent methyltransferase